MTPTERPLKDGPRFSIVVAVYNVAPYLADFISSIEGQSFDLARAEVIMVNDGSTDTSADTLKEWQRRSPGLVTVMTQTNEGQASARNLGLTVATGEWVTFTDPDDKLDQNYLQTVDRFLAQHPETEMVATNRLILTDTTGVLEDAHPLRKHFKGGDRVVNLDQRPTFFHVSAPAAFFKRERIAEQGLRFDARIRPNFEDGHFCISYLLASPVRNLAYLRSAKYIWRRRADQSSATQTSKSHPGRYTDVLEFGYLDVLRKACQQYGHVPFWLQNHMIYDLRWSLIAEATRSGSPTAAIGSVADRFHELMPQVLDYLEPGVIASFRVRPFRYIWRDILIHSWNDERWHTPYAVVSKLDEQRELARVMYRYVGAPPSEQFFIGEDPVEPQYSKHRSVRMFEREVIHERIAWVPTSGPISLRLNDGLVPFRSDWPSASTVYMSRERIRSSVAQDTPEKYSEALPPESKEEKQALRSSKKLLRRSTSGRMTRRFKNAWVLMDNVDSAGDNAEFLFRYLRDARPDINAWFVIAPKTRDWNRLQAAGYGKRVIPHGSDMWKILMANCTVLISSQAAVAVHRPPEITELVEPNWRFVCLPHEIIRDDLGNRFNEQHIDLIVTSSPDDLTSLTDDGTDYLYTTKDVKLVEPHRPDLRAQSKQEPPVTNIRLDNDYVQEQVVSEIERLVTPSLTSPR